MKLNDGRADSAERRAMREFKDLKIAVVGTGYVENNRFNRKNTINKEF